MNLPHFHWFYFHSLSLPRSPVSISMSSSTFTFALPKVKVFWVKGGGRNHLWMGEMRKMREFIHPSTFWTFTLSNLAPVFIMFAFRSRLFIERWGMSMTFRELFVVCFVRFRALDVKVTFTCRLRWSSESGAFIYVMKREKGHLIQRNLGFFPSFFRC